MPQLLHGHTRCMSQDLIGPLRPKIAIAMTMTSQTMPHGTEVESSNQRTEQEDPNQFLRTEFLQRLAHDLRGHAGVIHGALQELEASLGEQVASGELFLGMAKRGVKRILRTADKLQQTGQIER